MRITITKPLFAWDCLEDSPSLKIVRGFLAAVRTTHCSRRCSRIGGEAEMTIRSTCYGARCC